MTDDEIPLNIAGHEARERPSDSSKAGESSFEFADEPTNGSESSTESGDESVAEKEDGDVDGELVAEKEDGDEDAEPVELLVQLAKNGEINPWDIDIVAVTDKFLDALDDGDLRTSGRALFYASVLLRMKSDELFEPNEPNEDEIPPWEVPMGEEGGEFGPEFDPVAGLEQEMERRLERKHARGKPETLDELIRELRDAERGTWWKRSREYDTSDSPRGFARGTHELSYHAGDDYRVEDEPTADDVTHTAHAEDIETVIADVEDELEIQYENGREEVLFAEIDESGGSRVMTYLALLFLSHRGRITLEQDELFGDLWVQRVTLDTEEEASEALAD